MKISKNLVVKEANEVKKFFDKNKKLPKYATINNSQFTPSQYSYVFAKMVSKMGLPTVNKMMVADPKSDDGDVVDFILGQSEYVQLALKIVSFMEVNKRCPNYAMYKNKKIGWSLYTYCFIKILSFYKENNRLPSTCSFNSKEMKNTNTATATPKKVTSTSTSSSKKTTKKTKSNCENPYTNYPKDTVQGSGRLGQKTPYYCLPHSFRSCMYKFGLKLDETKIAQVMGTTTNGTGHEGVGYAIKWVKKNYNKDFIYEWKYLSDLGKTTEEQLLVLAKLMCRDDTDIIVHSQYQYKYGHYETIYKIDTSKKIVYVLNSLGYRDGFGYKGHVEQRSYSTFKGYINAKKGVQSICIIRKK
ncbi:MAG: hypothetical protein J6Y78_11105 [Paludibacteraceae bacterium]|nr:hypothetical protein [Paludibacteraceae bacterium]